MDWKSLALVGLVALMPNDCWAQKKESVGDTPKPQSIEVGDIAPDWELTGSDGKTYKLSDFKGKTAVVMAWYPAALTGG